REMTAQGLKRVAFQTEIVLNDKISHTEQKKPVDSAGFFCSVCAGLSWKSGKALCGVPGDGCERDGGRVATACCCPE
ncbi:hypothetical protein, partial [uncultured Desulfovibrio sp.]|uniref:hypothetical protein n=1 Tax=uncultured Desulfovibrio sp. TaxID=167968 RepID=UPI002605AC4E